VWVDVPGTHTGELSNLSTVCLIEHQAAYEEALAVEERALLIRGRRGDDHAILESKASLAFIQDSRGRYQEAEALYRFVSMD
jgi:hypothetical protein